MVFARMFASADLQILFVRGGQLIGRKDFYWGDTKEASEQELIRSAIEQFYNREMLPPKEVLIPMILSEQELIQQWLTDKKGEAVRVFTPKRGVKRHLLQLAQENAVTAIAEHLRKGVIEEKEAKELQKILCLSNELGRIEGFDISNTMGTNSVASMVVWEKGKMKKSDYRRFKVKTVEGANDFGSIYEVVKRRYGGSLNANSNKGLPLPDLILIDGGIGQLGAAIEALTELGLKHVPTIGLAKAKGEKEERIYLPGKREPVVLKSSSLASHLVQRIRDEAHRFAIIYHRKLRGQALVVPSKSSKSKRTMKSKPIPASVSSSGLKRPLGQVRLVAHSGLW